MDKNRDNPSHPAEPFPDVRWSHDRPILRKPVTVFVSSKFGSWLIRTATPLDRWILQRSKSRYTILGPLGLPLLLLTTVGRKTGQPRTTPLTYVRENGQLFVVGSNFGQDHHPAWSNNLLVNNHATVTIGGVDVPVEATPLLGAEKECTFERFVAIGEAYARYRDRTDRDLRIFCLVPR
ncbi:MULTISPECIES: nitroreductase family deazaflavin-dependent oxidoreductase [Rhodococcus]|uniref:nitroreductase family deazaflavin-dependent oxidoreductase n=1 Tax=Rhodococcus globerulus TaxID=33008 RepID=UPI001C593514|nr:nitroreductase family deazaflavin-dependent oxidoreductase [Rhodococcus globerulus]QXW03236.1 nitroreductase family deazaflavin-dependent oxidoreductase [Rhodococcus globerulus]